MTLKTEEMLLKNLFFITGIKYILKCFIIEKLGEHKRFLSETLRKILPTTF